MFLQPWRLKPREKPEAIGKLGALNMDRLASKKVKTDILSSY